MQSCLVILIVLLLISCGSPVSGKLVGGFIFPHGKGNWHTTGNYIHELIPVQEV